MPSLILLLLAALALLVLGLVPNGRGARLLPGAAGLGLLAALSGTLLPGAQLSSGYALLPAFALDGWSAVPLASLFLLTACGGARPAVAGLLALAMLAADGISLTLAAAAATLLAGPPLVSLPGPTWIRAAAISACLAVAVIVLGGSNPAFANMGLPRGPWGAVLAVSTLAAAACLTLSVPRLGGLAGVYLAGRLLLQLPGPVTPGWWGGPLLALGAALALLGARRTAAAAELDDTLDGAALAVQGTAMLALGTALLARGADLLPLAATAVAAGLLLLLGWGIWGGLLALCAPVVQPGTLTRLGGVLRRAPATGLAMLAGLLCLGAAPLTPGFAAGWLVVESVMGAGRTAGLGGLLLVAGALSALGLVAALLAAGALRTAGLVLLGPSRTARATAIAEPPAPLRLAMAALAALALLLGLLPGTGLALVQAGTTLLAGGPMPGTGWWSIGLPDGPGYLAPGLALLLLLALAAALAAARGPVGVAAPWQGGFAEDGVGRGNAAPVRLSRWRPHPQPGPALLAGLAFCLAALLGWAAR